AAVDREVGALEPAGDQVLALRAASGRGPHLTRADEGRLVRRGVSRDQPAAADRLDGHVSADGRLGGRVEEHHADVPAALGAEALVGVWVDALAVGARGRRRGHPPAERIGPARADRLEALELVLVAEPEALTHHPDAARGAAQPRIVTGPAEPA